MQKCMEKLNANAVGVAAHSDPLNQNGITLIALIITIIVMLILVGVTINVALNGGLFEKAEQAAVGTEKQAIYEQIVSNIELTNDGKISVKGTFDKVIAEFGTDKVTNINPATVDENTTEVTFSVVGKTGTYNYKISTKGIEKDPVKSPGGQIQVKAYQMPEAMGGGVVIWTLENELIVFDDSSILPSSILNLESDTTGYTVNYSDDFEGDDTDSFKVLFNTSASLVVARMPSGDEGYLGEINGNIINITKDITLKSDDSLLAQYYHNSTEYSYYNTEGFYYKWSTGTMSYSDCIVYINYEGKDAKVIAYMDNPHTSEIEVIYNSSISFIETLSDDEIIEIRTGMEESKKESVTINAGAKKINLADGEIGYIQGDNIYILNGCLTKTPFVNSHILPN